jgi:two-component system CheB/CheR fusion protein
MTSAELGVTSAELGVTSAELGVTSAELGVTSAELGAIKNRLFRLSAHGITREEPTILLAFEDITDRKAREATLARTEEALRDADRRKDEFLAALSHELRNPLTPIKNSLSVLGRRDLDTRAVDRAQQIIDRQVSHLTRLVDDLLDVTRITRGKIILQREKLNLADLVRRTLDDHRASFDASGVRLEGRIEAGAFWVDGDPARLVQVLSNVLCNAEKFTPRGGTVTVRLRRESGRASLEVHDTGMGIAPDVLRGLFEPFAQAPQTLDRARGGLGLGLAMAKGLVELHGGAIDIASDGPGTGTLVTMRLPLETSAPLSAARTPAAQTDARRRVLVVEDHVDSAESLRFALALDGHDVQIAGDGASGLVLAERFRPEIVFCDIGLPDMDGFAVARAFRERPALARTHLVALSGYAQREDVRRALAAGFDQHVAKPPELEKLRQILAEAPAAVAG